MQDEEAVINAISGFTFILWSFPPQTIVILAQFKLFTRQSGPGTYLPSSSRFLIYGEIPQVTLFYSNTRMILDYSTGHTDQWCRIIAGVIRSETSRISFNNIKFKYRPRAFLDILSYVSMIIDQRTFSIQCSLYYILFVLCKLFLHLNNLILPLSQFRNINLIPFDLWIGISINNIILVYIEIYNQCNWRYKDIENIYKNFLI